MRQVIFKRWIKNIPGIGQWEREMTHQGLFHQWGYEVVDNGESAHSQSVAIVENPDGTVETVLPHNLRFLS